MRNEVFRHRYGSWAAVTGASDGIGRAIAMELAARGLNVVLAARSKERLETVSRSLESAHGVKTQSIACDLGTASGRQAFLSATEGLDVGLLVAAAGFGTSGPLLSGDLQTERAMLEVNCWAALEQCAAFGGRLAQRGRGGIVLMSSLVSWQGVPRAAHYAATKAYVQSLAEALQRELAPSGVDVLASAPGPVNSGFGARAGMDMGRAETPEAVARATILALGKRSTVVPGGLSKLLTYSLAPLPRWARVRILERVMSGMTATPSPVRR